MRSPRCFKNGYYAWTKRPESQQKKRQEALKKELIFHETFTTREKAKQRIFEYIECFYNAERIHSANEYMSPMEYEKMHQQGKKAATFLTISYEIRDIFPLEKGNGLPNRSPSQEATKRSAVVGF